VELLAQGCRCQQLIAHPPREVPIDAGRASVVAVRVIGQPFFLDRAVAPFRERK
jgi:hypothetical protein